MPGSSAGARPSAVLASTPSASVLPHEKLNTAEASRVFAGRYEILAKLGQGAFGIVYRALDKVLDREVALKILKLDKIGEAEQAEEYRQRFLREAQTVAKLSHPNIIPVYDLGEAQGYYYIAMALVTGRPLDEFIRDKEPMSAERVVRIGAALADALGYAHAKGVIHRDIKPANIIIDEGDVPRIADFGIAKVQHDPHRTRDNVIVGTLSYMSPEQLSGETLDGRSDLFSLGCVLVELLTKHRPFDGPNMTAIVNKIIHDSVDFVSLEKADAPRDLVTILRRVLEKDRDRRFANGGELRDALEKLLPERQADTTELRRMAAEIERLKQENKKEKKRAAIAMLVVALGGFAIWVFVQKLETSVLAFLPIFALVSPAVLIALFYRDVLGRLNPIYWMLSGLFSVLVLVDSYYFWKLAYTATEIAVLFKQSIPPLTLAHYDVAGVIVNNLFLVALVVNLAIIIVRKRRVKIVENLNRVPVAVTATALLAGFMVFMFAAMAGHWNAMTAGLNLQLMTSKIRQLEEEGKYQEVLEKFIKGTKPEMLQKPEWQRRLARMYRVTGKNGEMRKAWENLSKASVEHWDENDAACYLAVGRDFAKLDLYREDAVAVFRMGRSVAPRDPNLALELAKMYDRMGFSGEAALVRFEMTGPNFVSTPPVTAPATSSAPATAGTSEANSPPPH